MRSRWASTSRTTSRTANPNPDPDPDPEPDPDPDPNPNPDQVRASLDMYSSILKKIEDNDYDNFNLRAYTPKWQKLMMIPYSTLKVKMNEGKS